MPHAAIISRLTLPRHFFAALACLLLVLPGARAESGGTTISTTEDIVLAFYKTGGAVPNFEKWVKEREPYRTTALARRPETLEREITRLKNLYAAFDPKTDFLTVKTSARARAVEMLDPADPSRTIHGLAMEFDAGDADYFPYDFMGERFAVIPKELELHLNPVLPRTQYDYLLDVLEKGKPVTMILELRPAKADMTAPFDMDGTGGGPDEKDGKGQWMFLTDIASMSIWNRAGTLLWEYTAPWYVTPMRDSLLDLHTDKSAGQTRD